MEISILKMFKAEFIFLKRNCPRWRPAGKCYESGPLFKWRNQACIQIAECLSPKFRSFDQQLAHYSPVDQFKFKRPWIYRLKQTCQFEPFKKKKFKNSFQHFCYNFFGGKKILPVGAKWKLNRQVWKLQSRGGWWWKEEWNRWQQVVDFHGGPHAPLTSQLPDSVSLHTDPPRLPFFAFFHL